MPSIINDLPFLVERRYTSHQKTHILESRKDKGTFGSYKKTRNARQIYMSQPESHYVILYERLKTKMVNQDLSQRFEVMKGHIVSIHL